MKNRSATPPVSRPAPPADSGLRVRLFRAALALCFLGSLALSYRLWTSERDYPLVPVLDGLPQPPAPVNAVLFWAMAAALLAAAALPRPRVALAVVLGIGGVWAVLDQNRWQPYFAFYMVGVLCLWLSARAEAAPDRRHASAWWLVPFQLLVGSMYVWSGLHKLNRHYVATDFLLTAKPLLGWLGAEPASVPAGLVTVLALLSAVLELGFGVLLWVPKLRRAGVVGLTATHLFVLAMIGPLGADYNRVVWPWNVAAVAALWLLFWPEGTGTQPAALLRAWLAPADPRGRGGAGVPRGLAWTCGAVLLLFGVLPALSLAERWDAGLSWQMYAGKERIAVLFHEGDARAALPPAGAAAERAAGQVNLGAWSMAELSATPVLADRVLLRIGSALARRAPGANVGLAIGGTPDVFFGERETRYFVFPAPGHEPVDVSGQYRVELQEDVGM